MAGASRQGVLITCGLLLGAGLLGRAAAHEYAHQLLPALQIDDSTDVSSYEYPSAARDPQYDGPMRRAFAWPELQRRIGIAPGVASQIQAPSPAQPRSGVVVNTTEAFHAALREARAGTVIALAPGTYAGGAYRSGLVGTAEAPVVIRAADPARPPVFAGGDTGIQLSDARHVAFEDLIFEGARQNGINIDDGSTFETPSQHIRLTRITVRDVERGNHDGIKLSGVTDFIIEEVTIERWGDSGSAIDMVGCRRGVIRGSVFRHTPGMPVGNGVQAKGGTAQVTITGNRFEDAAARAVQIGGTTSLSLFRPQPHGRAEAQEILVERNVIVGSETAVAFVGSDGGVVRFNTIYLPAKWPLRILQENRDSSLVPARNGVFTDNIVYWRGNQVINVGSYTDASSFSFARNWWYRQGAPASSRMTLPNVEADGVYGVDPRFVAPPIDLRTRNDLPSGAFAAP